MVVIADDLTGAADCAASSAARGCRAAVLLHSPDQESEAGWPDTDILSIDANTRCQPAEQSSEIMARLVHLCDSQQTDNPGYVLFKKIDSTLRGNVAAELSALLQARRSGKPANAKLSVLLAPALPAQGRTTVGGRIVVYGVPLEETDIWNAEVRAPQSDIRKLITDSGLSCGSIEIDIVRSSSTCLRRAIAQTAELTDVVVCDAETDEDLGAIASASTGQPAITALAGSAGLAFQIAREIDVAAAAQVRTWSFAAGPTLFLVGTTASLSMQQARMLEDIPDVATFHTGPGSLRTSPGGIQADIVQNLRSGRDVLLLLDESDHCSTYDWQFLPQALSNLLSECQQYLGGLVATGGETARAALDALGIRRLRLLGEVEPGLPISVADHWVRPLPVVTKAGAFGSTQALVLCREFLRGRRRVRMSFDLENLFKDRES
jgi:D-threonate/D-erythronate kinase